MRAAAAEHDADLLRAALRDDDTDPARLASLLRGVEQALSDLTGPGGTLTAADRAYLEAFYGQLSARDLAALGSLRWGRSAEDVGSEESRAANQAMTITANGITALLDPGAGSIDPDAEFSGVPAGIRDYVYDYEALLADRDPETVRKFDAFGRLMDMTTLSPGEAFGVALGHAALGHEELTRDARPDDHPLPSGSRGLINAAASAGDAPTRLMADPRFTAGLLESTWYQPESRNGFETRTLVPEDAIGRFLVAATSVPDLYDPSDPPDRKTYADAAYNYLSYVQEHGWRAPYADRTLVTSLLDEYGGRAGQERFEKFASLRAGR
jgi:hypothetical protein